MEGRVRRIQNLINNVNDSISDQNIGLNDPGIVNVDDAVVISGHCDVDAYRQD